MYIKKPRFAFKILAILRGDFTSWANLPNKKIKISFSSIKCCIEVHHISNIKIRLIVSR